MMNKNHKSFVCGLKGKYLSKDEKKFLIKHKPWGIILFSRNIKTIKQTKILTNSIKRIFKNENYPILIDEEGGRVTRLKNFIDSSIFTAKYFGDLYNKNVIFLYKNPYFYNTNVICLPTPMGGLFYDLGAPRRYSANIYSLLRNISRFQKIVFFF